jgi:hypothetical protein
MARELKVYSLTNRIAWKYKNVLTDAETPTYDSEYGYAADLTTGTGSGEADRIFTSQGRELTSGTSEDIDLYDLNLLDIGAGAGNDPLGQPWVVREIVYLSIVNSSTSDGTLKVGGKGNAQTWSAPFNGDDDALVLVVPRGFVQLYGASDPAYAVANTTNHVLKIEASGGDCTYDIVVVARSA